MYGDLNCINNYCKFSKKNVLVFKCGNEMIELGLRRLYVMLLC